VAATASNPLTIATWAAIFTAAGAAAVADAAASPAGAGLMLSGVALGTLTAFTALSLLVSLVRGRFGPRLMATVDVVAGAGLLGFAGLLGRRAVDDA
jgi:putative LysE/RhtB family amino acid efflux pump